MNIRKYLNILLKGKKEHYQIVCKLLFQLWKNACIYSKTRRKYIKRMTVTLSGCDYVILIYSIVYVPNFLLWFYIYCYKSVQTNTNFLRQ